MGANDRQEYGDHYQAEFQHWDLVERYNIGYLEGCATKYLTRWRKKNGLQDLKKAKHYTEKLAELKEEIHRGPRGYVGSRTLFQFFAANGITNTMEQEAIALLCGSWSLGDLHVVVGIIDALIAEVAEVSGS